MKKFYYLFLLLPFSLFVSCDKDDVSPVDMTLTMQGVTQSNNTFYTVIGEEVNIEYFSVKSIDGKNSAVTNVVFSLNGIPIMGEPGSPYIASFSTENLKAGTYSINITGNLLQVDSSIQVFAINYPLTIVENSEDLPAGAPDLGSYSQTIRVSD